MAWTGSEARESGVALVLTLLVITILCVMVVEFNYLMRVDITIAANIRDGNRALYIAKAGVNVAMAILRKDDNNYDALSEDWGKLAELTRVPSIYSEYLGEGNMTVSIVDESGKINVNKIKVNKTTGESSASSQQLRELLTLLEIDVGIIDNIMDSIIDWIDRNLDPETYGAEDDYYQGLEDPYPCKDGTLETVSELLMVKGITEEIFYGTKEHKGIGEFLTVHSDGKININTADSLVLQALGYLEDDEWTYPIDEDMAQSIIDHRTTEVFEDESELRDNVDGMSEIYEDIEGQITVRTHFFSVDAVGEVNTVQKRIRTIIRREGGGSMKTFYWAVE